jgi:hypothetical protein
MPGTLTAPPRDACRWCAEVTPSRRAETLGSSWELLGSSHTTQPSNRAASIERISSMDLTALATDRGSVPMNIGAVLEFDQT